MSLCPGFSVLECHFPILERPFLLCPVLSRIPSRILAIPARPIPNFGYSGPNHPLARFLACPDVPLSQDNEGTTVPLSRKVALSRTVGNPSLDSRRQQSSILFLQSCLSAVSNSFILCEFSTYRHLLTDC